VQVIGGALLLANRFVPLALILLGTYSCEHPLVPFIDGAGGTADGPVRD
jgi:hypothetical protein